MSASLTLDPQHSAILSMDLQSGVVSVYGGPEPELIPRAAEILQAARARGFLVVHIQVGFRPGLPEVSPRNPLFSAVRNSPQHQEFFRDPSGAIHPALGPEEGDVVVTKHRVSAFAGTDLAMILRAREIDTLVLFGIATSGVVLSTLLEASDADYRILVVRDCCIDQDADLHSALVDKLFPRRATVLSASEVLAVLKSEA